MKFLTKNWGNKKIFFLFLSFLLLTLFLFWPSQTLAFWETLKNAILFLPYLGIALILLFLISISQAGAWLAGFLLDIAISPDLISLSYTNPAGNQIIALGLSITQSFVNLLLVVALVYTALSIALRINETGAKKMLVKLIIVALLVNFAPVFCGLVVDATNIVMYYFLKPIEEGPSRVLTQVGPFISMIYNTIWQAKVDLTERLGVLMMGVTAIMMNISMAIAFLLYAVIFLFRYVVIWVLVILAPLAFVGWVFPATKPEEHWEFLDWILFPLRMFRKFWDKWLEEFTQWAIIGIPMAFFLYLAMSSFSLMTAVFKQEIEMLGIEPAASGLLNEIFPYFVVIAFLFLGFSLGLQTDAMGTKAIIAGARAAHKKAQIRIRRAATAPVKPVITTYKTQKATGTTTFQALKHTVKTAPAAYWAKAKEAKTVIKTPKAWLPTVGKGISAVYKGTKSIVKDVWTVGKQTAKRGEKKVTCPSCGETVSDKKFCSNCGAVLP